MSATGVARSRGYYQSIGTPVETVVGLEKVSQRLRDLGYTKLEHLIHGSQVAHRDLSDFLQIDDGDLDTLIMAASSSAITIPQATLDKILAAKYGLGFAIEAFSSGPPSSSGYASPPPEGLPTDVVLIDEMGPIRDQGTRGTCVAHAAVALLEQHLKRADSYKDLSEQFSYWNCKQSDGIPHISGTWLGVAMPLMERVGCCLEVTWPYNSVPDPTNHGQGPPPEGAQLEALGFRPGIVKQLPPTSLLEIKSELNERRAVAFSIPIFDSWVRSSWVAYSGEITVPAPGEAMTGGHAMCLVGYFDLPTPEEPNGGRFLVRNSWGETWGSGCPYGRGYGAIPYSYVEKFCMEAYTIANR